MDDGLQHHAMQRDVSLLCLDARYKLGNGRLLPAGPLRESFARALARSDAVVAVTPFMGAVTSADELRDELEIPSEMPVIRACFSPEPDAAAALAGRRVLPFSGTARPHRFFDTLRKLGCSLTNECALPDHAPLIANLLDRLRATAHERGALLVTTAKDAARLSASARDGIHVLPMQLDWLPGDAEQIDRLLDPHIGSGVASGEQC